MNRGGFLKTLGVLFVGAAIKSNVPEFLISKEDELKTCLPSPPKNKWVNHMTIQRKTFTISGSGESQVLWYNFEDGKSEGFINEDFYNKLNNKA